MRACGVARMRMGMSWGLSVKATAYYGVPHSRTREDDRREYWFEFLNRDFDFFVLFLCSSRHTVLRCTPNSLAICVCDSPARFSAASENRCSVVI